jgi:serine/threonine-protein kinase HipA
MDAAYMALHGDLPRQGVGADWCTREAIRRLPPLRKPPAILDLGCGPGRQSIVLAQHFQNPIQAVDLNPVFLDQMMQSADAAGVAALIQPRQEDFRNLPEAEASQDLIWCEGAARVMGLSESFAQWGKLLRPRGVLAVSDMVWMTARPSPEAEAFWDKIYPSMTDLEGAQTKARKAGLKLFDHFFLPRTAWWDEYYAPLQRRIAQLKPQADGELAELLSQAENEIALFQRWGSCYGYIFMLLRPA